MSEPGADPFQYLAFDDDTGDLLAHGRTAASALREADELAPLAPIRVILAGSFGRTIWDRGVQLYVAENALTLARKAVEQLQSVKPFNRPVRIFH